MLKIFANMNLNMLMGVMLTKHVELVESTSDHTITNIKFSNTTSLTSSQWPLDPKPHKCKD